MKRKLLIGVTSFLALLGVTAFAFTPPTVSPEAIQSSVTREEALLNRAWQMPVASTMRDDLAFQSNASVCGAASIANVLHSLGEAADTEAEVLDDTNRCWFGVCPFGLTLDQLGEVAQANTERRVTVLRDLTPEQFREHLRQANNPGRRYIINFDREEIFGAGAGHHSPVGGYLEVEDLVFVLDVNSKFQPWLVERNRLFAAMDTLDGEKKRGLLLVE